MDKEVHYAAKFAMDLRLEIWKELFGFEISEMIDPCDDGFWKELKERAKVFIGFRMEMDFFIFTRTTLKFIGKCLPVTLIIR